MPEYHDNGLECIPLARPCVTDEMRERVLAVLDSGYLTEGPVTRALETSWAHFVGVSNAIAVTSCTTGLELVLRALGIGPGDEVLVPDYTYPATAFAARSLGADVGIVDVSPMTMLVDYDAMERAVGPRTRAIIPVSLFGNPLDYSRLGFARERGLHIVEDAACAVGAMFEGAHAGVEADAAVFSMHPRKSVTSGEGGIITTSNGLLAAQMRSRKHFGLDIEGIGGAPRFVREGTNLKLSDVLAAIGLAQMDMVHDILCDRRQLAERYAGLLADAQGVTLPEVTEGGMHGWQTFSVFVDGRDEIMARLRERGIEVQIGTYALHREPVFQNREYYTFHGDMAGSRWAYEHCLALPLFPGMTHAQQDRVVHELCMAVEWSSRRVASA